MMKIHSAMVIAIITGVVVFLFSLTVYQEPSRILKKFALLNTLDTKSEKEGKVVKNKVTSKQRCSFRENIAGVVLAINFNHPFYDNVPLLRATYEKHLGKLIFCGTKPSSDFDIILIPDTRGHHGYICVAKAIEKYPDYDGYFHSNDDVLLNIWNLNFDINQVWLGDVPKEHLGHEMGGKIDPRWPGWVIYEGARSCERAFGILEKFTQTKKGNYLTEYLEYYYENTNNTKLCLGCRADAHYVPKRYAVVYKTISDIFSNAKVPLEVATPTILHFIGLKSSQIHIKGMYYVDHGLNFHNSYNFNISFSHPFKLSNADNLRFFIHTFLKEMYRRIDDCN